MSYGYAGLSDPEFETPSNVHPGAPSAVRLLETSDSSIAVEWDHPTVDGGADVAGYELWMGEWATSSFRLVYDGVDDEDTTSFTVDARYKALSIRRWLFDQHRGYAQRVGRMSVGRQKCLHSVRASSSSGVS